MHRSPMRSLSLLSLALVAVATVAVMPVSTLAQATPTVLPATDGAAQVPTLEEQLEAPPNQTPAPTPTEVEKLADPTRELRVETIRACTSWEEQQCGCTNCVVVNNEVRCFC